MTDDQIKVATSLHVAAATAGMMVVLGWSVWTMAAMRSGWLR